MSPIILIGAQNGHGSQSPLINPLTFWCLILLKKISPKLISPSGSVTP